MTPPLVSVIVVCFNEKHFLAGCLSSLKRQTHPNLEVILVDNGSTDGSADYVRSEHPWVRVREIGHDTGYANANNVGFSEANGEYVAVLTPDTEAEPDFVRGLVESLEEKGVGLATSRICFFDQRDTVNACGNDVHLSGVGFCHGFRMPAREFESPGSVAAISGAAFMTRRDVLDCIGGFDNDFFMYVEDTDLSLRARIAGYRIEYAPRSIVYHRYGLRMRPEKFFLIERNRRLTLLKNFRWGTLVALLPNVWMTGLLMWTYAFVHGPAYVKAKAQAHWWIYRHWGMVLEKRRATQKVRRVGDREVVRTLSSTLPTDQVVGEGLLSRLIGIPMNLTYQLLAIPARLLG